MTDQKPSHANDPDRADSPTETEISASDRNENPSSSPTPDPANADGDAKDPQVSEPDSAEDKSREYYDKLVRTMADFDNYKKRAARERLDTARYACAALLEKLLPVLDNLEMAMSATEKAQDQSVDSLKTGVSMVLQQFKSALRESGMEEINAAGQPFNPNLHEAVSQQETADVPEGHVSVQLRKGYKLHDRLLRPASVVVAKSPTAGSADKDNGEDDNRQHPASSS